MQMVRPSIKADVLGGGWRADAAQRLEALNRIAFPLLLRPLATLEWLDWLHWNRRWPLASFTFPANTWSSLDYAA